MLGMGTHAQDRKTNQSNQQWAQYGFQMPVSSKLKLVSDMGFRWKDTFSNPSQYYLRAGVSRNLLKKSQITFGLAHFGTLFDGDLVQNEYRGFQDLVVSDQWSKTVVSQRFRIEERFFYDPVKDKSSFVLRWRYRWQFIIPLISFNDSSKLSLSLAEEILLNTGGKQVVNILDQNRILIGPIMQWNSKWSTQFIYQNQYATTSFIDVYNMKHIFWLSISQKFGN